MGNVWQNAEVWCDGRQCDLLSWSGARPVWRVIGEVEWRVIGEAHKCIGAYSDIVAFYLLFEGDRPPMEIAQYFRVVLGDTRWVCKCIACSDPMDVANRIIGFTGQERV